MSRNYHKIQYRISVTGDVFRINGVDVCLPFSAATQTDNALIPQRYHILEMVVSILAAKGASVSRTMVGELGNVVAHYVRTFRNDRAAAKSFPRCE